MRKMIFYIAISTACISLELKCMEEKRSNVLGLLNDSDVKVVDSKKELEGWTAELAKQAKIARIQQQQEHQKRIAALKVGMNNLSATIETAQNKRYLDFKNFTASKRSKQGYAQVTEGTAYTFEGVMPAAPSNNAALN